MIYIIHLVSCLCHLELYWLHNDSFSEGSENQLKRPGTERVKSRNILRNMFLKIADYLYYTSFDKF